MWKSEICSRPRTNPAGIPLVRLSFLLVSNDRMSEILNPGFPFKQGPGGSLSIKMPSYQYKDLHVKDKTVSQPSYL